MKELNWFVEKLEEQGVQVDRERISTEENELYIESIDNSLTSQAEGRTSKESNLRNNAP